VLIVQSFAIPAAIVQIAYLNVPSLPKVLVACLANGKLDQGLINYLWRTTVDEWSARLPLVISSNLYGLADGQ
jgi:hypothetical protein